MTMIDKDKEKSQPAVSNDTGTRRNEPASPRPKTNEGIDVILVPSYLSSPVKTIVASTTLASQIPTHDLLDAYHILAIRLKTVVAVVPESISVSTHPALEYLRANSVCLLQALSRDIRRALAKPFLSATQSASSDELVPEWTASTTHTPSHAQGAQIKTNEVNNILGSVILCHYALRLVCIILRFEGLHQYFEGELVSRSWHQHRVLIYPQHKIFTAFFSRFLHSSLNLRPKFRCYQRQIARRLEHWLCGSSSPNVSLAPS